MTETQKRETVVREAIVDAEQGKTEGVGTVDRMHKADPASTEAIEQEAAEAPEGRALSR